MLKEKRYIIGFILVNAFILIGWNILFRSNEWLASLDILVLQTIAVAFCFIQFYKAYKKTHSQQKIFWHLLSIGTVFYLIGNSLWLFMQIINGGFLSTSVEFFFWLLARIIYLVALFYRIRRINTTKFKKVYFFNILIFMITTVAITIYYLIEPTVNYAEHSVVAIIITLMYPTINLSILLMIFILSYLVHKKIESSVMLFLIMGFVMTFIGDTYYSYLETYNSYYPGSLVNYFWLIGTFLLGLTGYYAKRNREVRDLSTEDFDLQKVVINPYISTLVLIILVINSYDWAVNALSFGVLIVIGMIIIRQLFIIKENGELIDEYSYLAYHDPLTNLSNRAKFTETLELEMERVQDREISLLLIDLDRFKVANDTLGHQIGDEILVKAAKRIEEVLEPDMQVFRLGGDEFAVIILQKTDSRCKGMAEKILQNIQKPFKINDYEVSLTASIGISVFPKNGKSYEELFKFADTAMYLAKDSGKNGFKYYDDDLSEVMGRRLRIESDLRKGLEKNQFKLYYQPKVDLLSREMIGMEALLRWNHPEFGWISPEEFIPIAEETGQVVAIGEWVLRNACKQNKIWQEKGLPAIKVCVNVSVKQFQHGGLLMIIEKALEESGLQPHYLEIEVTESIMQNTSETSEVLHQIREMGIEIAIDDFGTGYSSLTVIQQLPIDTIKLDKSFITGIKDDNQNNNQIDMVKTIITLGENLKLDVVAEGVETEYQLMKLIESRCKIGQGYLFSKPVEPSQLEELLKRKQL
ncbi:bifunctional diguanylate cyclase/phosphodiesterase [Marinilactibacillus sp. Marseille-P9653]|uniref:putative bifunctional diguanylate cyclase/phosphodiesterase n=1 Tax=Marinilactibacillus sp. Marseille-P9653 TaxID=2866583 RepID=UPI001CE4125A|nr:EAL domain-containing protein [Marinilactibacillus sp. Marseille-P9653]